MPPPAAVDKGVQIEGEDSVGTDQPSQVAEDRLWRAPWPDACFKAPARLGTLQRPVFGHERENLGQWDFPEPK